MVKGLILVSEWSEIAKKQRGKMLGIVQLG